MATIVFAALIVLSLALALASKGGHHPNSAKDFFIASRQFGSWLVFFLVVGEVYSIGTIIGFPGGIYAKGGTYGIWFLGYILLAYPVGYFLNPWIWRAGKRYDAVTLPDVFKGHFAGQYGRRALELTATIAAITFLVPWGQIQFGGIIVALHGLGWDIDSRALAVVAAILAFCYVAISGIRAPAYVAILKDILMMAAIVITGMAAVTAVGGVSPIFEAAKSAANNHLDQQELRFTMSTILFQALGFWLLPFNVQGIFTARSEQTVRRTQMVMPLYMLMFPFLVVTAYYALEHHVVGGGAANNAFIAAAVHLLPGWAIGIIAAGASLSGLLVLAGICLAIGPLVSRNLFSHIPEQKQRGVTKVIVAGYLLVSIALTLFAPTLLLTVNNTAFFGMTQFFPGVLCVLFFKRANPIAIAVGMVVADVLCIAFYVMQTPLYGINIGLVGLIINICIVAAGSFAALILKGEMPNPIPVAYQPAKVLQPSE
ncbi:sodium:solute symporter family protein [Bradyrhizobium sp. SYSU BS000235]|uniref:sodium:solute symporter family protein n=1 Tax=Bradyrhizobium sp. SYSU BS000235 TaxID=3411332 RepID=UPI003C77A7C6